MFPNHFIPGTEGKKADWENAYSSLRVSVEEGKSLHELKKSSPEIKKQSLLLSCPGGAEVALDLCVN